MVDALKADVLMDVAEDRNFDAKFDVGYFSLR